MFFSFEKRPFAKMDIFKNVQNRFATFKPKLLFFLFFGKYNIIKVFK